MKHFKLLVFLLINYGIILGQSQSSKVSISIPSTNSLNLGRYIETPVSQFTGIPNISLPIYTLKGKEIDLPITINYHSGGVLPEIHPGWVGQGWSTMSGGAIIRRGKGLHDEKKWQNIAVGYYWRRGMINNNTIWPNSLGDSLSMLVTRPGDYEPDEFHFSFLGIQGVFFLDQTGQWRVQSDRNIKVIFDESTGFMPTYEVFGMNWVANSYSPFFYKFTLIDEFGNQYIFGGDKNSIEFSSNASDRDGESITATSWHLTKIISANKNDIYSLKYFRGPHTAQLYWMLNNLSVSSVNFESDSQEKRKSTLGGSFTSPVYLSEITLNNSLKVNFHSTASSNLKYKKEFLIKLYEESYNIYYKPQYSFNILENNDIDIPYYSGKTFFDKLDKIIWMQLDSITISNNSNNVLNNISFNYNTNKDERLFLESINIYGSKKYSKQYGFHYKDRSKLFGFLETYTDHWGYNNGKIVSIDLSNYSILRAPDSNFVFAGVLDTIYLPTGGKTGFLYDINSYSKVVNFFLRDSIETEEGTSSGLRIKSIKNYDANGNIDEMTYQYKSSFPLVSQKSSGVLYNRPNYFSYVLESSNGKFISFNRQSSSAVPLIDFSNSNVTYSQVIESISHNGQNIGHTVSIFTNHDNGYFDLMPLALYARTPFMSNPSSSRGFERGKMIKKIIYKTDLKPIQITEYKWNRYEIYGHEIRSLLFDLILFSEAFYYSAVAYKLFNYPFLLTEQSTYDYIEDGSFIKSVTNYSYNSNKQIIRTERVLSDGTSLIDTRRYPDDFIGQYSTGTLAEWNTLKSMVNSGMVAYPIEVRQYHKKSNGFKSLVDAMVYIYKDTLTKSLLTSFYKYNYAGLIDSSSYTPLNVSPNSTSILMDSRLLLEEKYSYNNSFLIKEVTSKDGFKTSYLWGYNNMYPIAKINNSSYSNVEEVLGNYEVSRLANGFPKRFEIDYMSNILRSSPLLQKSQVYSYSYIPQVGMDLMISPNGTKTQYSYDGFSRLNTIRDNNNNIKERLLYHYQNNNDFEEITPINSLPQTFVLTYTSSIGGSLAAKSRIVEANTILNLYSEIPVTACSGFLFDGYYVEGVRITNPSSYLVQSNATINAQFAPVEQDPVEQSFEVAVMLGTDQLIESSYDVQVIGGGSGTILASQRISPNDPALSCLINNSIFPISVSITTRTYLPSLRIKVDEVVVFENFGPVPGGYSFSTQEIGAGQHVITVETP